MNQEDRFAALEDALAALHARVKTLEAESRAFEGELIETRLKFGRALIQLGERVNAKPIELQRF